MKNGELSACRKVRRFSDGNPVSNANRAFALAKGPVSRQQRPGRQLAEDFAGCQRMTR